jgi:hypothetical protein
VQPYLVFGSTQSRSRWNKESNDAMDPLKKMFEFDFKVKERQIDLYLCRWLIQSMNLRKVN